MMDSAKVEMYKKAYPTGARMRCLYMDDPYSPIQHGEEGTVVFVDDVGTIHVRWDNGRTIGLIPTVDGFMRVD